MNLRDKGFSSSMEGYTPKKQERHTREKSVAPGEAIVQKGQKVQPTRDLPNYGSVPEYGATGAPAVDIPYASNQSIPLHYTDLNDQLYHFAKVELPYRKGEQNRKIRDGYLSTLSDEELKRRLAELEQALSTAYAQQNTDRQARRNIPTGEEGHYPEEVLANYNWNVHDVLDDYVADTTDDPVALYLEQMEHAKAAATGRVINKQALRKNLAAQDAYPARYNSATQKIADDERSIDDLYFEYNNLKNEYNTRLARYLQSIGG